MKFSLNHQTSVQRCLNPYFNASFFYFPNFFEDISTPKLESTKWLTVLVNTFVLQDQSQGYIPAYSRVLSLSRMLVKFSLKLVCSTMCEKDSQIYGVHIPRKCIEFRQFYPCPLLTRNPAPKFLSSHL